jgi:hypothetical protein
LKSSICFLTLRIAAQGFSVGSNQPIEAGSVPARSALALFVTRVGADHTHHTLAADDLAIAAHLLDGSCDFHGLLLDPRS